MIQQPSQNEKLSQNCFYIIFICKLTFTHHFYTKIIHQYLCMHWVPAFHTTMYHVCQNLIDDLLKFQYWTWQNFHCLLFHWTLTICAWCTLDNSVFSNAVWGYSHVLMIGLLKKHFSSLDLKTFLGFGIQFAI